MKNKLRDVAIALVLSACGQKEAQLPPVSPGAASEATVLTPGANAKMIRVLAGSQRTDAERARDNYRHPRETLAFFGLTDGMKVVELSAGKGWYTSILAPFLRPSGALTVTGADPNGPPDSEGTKNAKELAARLAADPENFSNVAVLVTDWKNPGTALGTEGSADMVVTFRNLHGWISNGVVDTVLSASFRVLKHGGVFGVVEHRAKSDGSTESKAIGETGYVPEAYVVKIAEAAGFKLAGKSEVNANPKDTKDYPKGVWTLPPTLKLGDVDRDKYLAIGESDRMTLKFLKP